MTQKHVTQIGWFASLMAIAMYTSYIDQIRLNLSGQTGSVLIPIITVINCTAWTMYGSAKATRDWPIIACNVPGIIFGIVTAATAIKW